MKIERILVCILLYSAITACIARAQVISELVLEDVEHPNEVYLFTGDDSQSLRYKFVNKSEYNLKLMYSIAVFAHDKRLISKNEGEFSMDAKTTCVQSLVSKTKSLPYGVYYAVLEVSEKSTNQKLLENKTFFGVTTGTQIRKANDGEFLYGMDPCLGHFYENEYLLKWMDYTGTDIVRLGIWDDKISDVEKYYPVYKAHNLRLSINFDPPKDSDSTLRMKHLREKCDFLEEMARKYPDFKYYELGNEPDLFGFYPGPIEEYIYSIQEMYKAIKRGNPQTIVMNGGLCFFGDEGNARANRFIEIVDTNYIDAFAYHAHGYGSESEKAGYDIIVQALTKAKKTNKLMVDTESGTPTVTNEQEKMQAATALQKQVFAQSVGLEYLMWFRFLFFEEPYGNLYSIREPRPVVIAYRNMVETLRGYTFYKKVDVGKKGAESYVFKEMKGNGRIIIAWVNEPVDYAVTYQIASNNGKVENAEIIDVYGNTKPLEVLKDGSVKTDVDERPVYIRWQAEDTAFEIAKGSSVIEVMPETILGINNVNTLELVVKNPLEKAIDGTVSFKAGGSIPVVFEPAVIHAKLLPGETRTIKVNAIPQRKNERIIWPVEWTVYTWVDNFTPEGLTKLPSSIKVKDAVIYGQKVSMVANLIDFAKISGRWKEKALALAFAEIQSYADTVVNVGTAGDWWMDWYVNGQPVYNTLKNGNAGTMSITEHVFKIKLKKGKNIIAAKVLSGLGGWKLAFGNNADLENLQNKTKNSIEVSLTADNKVLATEKSLVQFVNPIPFVSEAQLNSSLINWNLEVLMAQIKDKGVFNFFDKFPDNTKWWKGEDDLSANLWIRQDKNNIHIILKVKDDKYTTPTNGKDLLKHDAVLLAFAAPENSMKEYIITTIDQKAFVGKYPGHYLTREAVKDSFIKATIKRESTITWYTISVPKSTLNKNGNLINILINDGDWGQRKQFIEWLPGLGKDLDTSLWHKIVF